MPRIANIYSIPPGTEGFPDQTIESEKYNNYVHDVETDLNLPRPISAGGTGATSADGALANLHAEKFGQEITNYGSDVLVAGSFFSRTTATDPPVALHAFSGIVHVTDANNMVMHAVDLTDAFKAVWTRVKTAGTWGAWIKGSTYASLTCADTPPADAPDNALWFESDTGLLYVRYNDGDSTQWTIACPQPDVGSYILKEGDTMEGPLILPADAPTLDLQAVNKKYVDDSVAVPVDVLAYSGMQINGAMEVGQERFAIATAANGAYACDGWKVLTAGTMVVGAGIGQAPLIATGLPNYLAMNVSVAQPALGATDHAALCQFLEGYQISRLGWGSSYPQPITIAFWSKHDKPGLYSVAIRNGTRLTRSYVATYQHIVQGVSQYNVITIPGDASSTWNVGAVATAEFSVTFTVACGATYTASSPNTWLAGNFFAAPGQVNGVSAAASDLLRISGVIILPGTQSPSALQSANVMRPYIQELQSCKRYYYKRVLSILGYGAASGQVGGWFVHPVTMRVAPPFITTLGGTATNTNGTTTFQNITVDGLRIHVNATAAGTCAMEGFTQTADARM